MADDLLLVGRVARAHGNRGQVIVNPDTDFAGDRFKPGKTLLVGPAEGPQGRAIQEVRFHQGRPIVKFEGVDTMNDAEALAGAELWLTPEAAGPLPDRTYYRHDLVGCRVIDTAGAELGVVGAVEGTLERSYLVVKTDAGDVMIPMVAEFCIEVDLELRRIVVTLPDGLLEVNAPTARVAADRGARRADSE